MSSAERAAPRAPAIENQTEFRDIKFKSWGVGKIVCTKKSTAESKIIRFLLFVTFSMSGVLRWFGAFTHGSQNFNSVLQLLGHSCVPRSPQRSRTKVNSAFLKVPTLLVNRQLHSETLPALNLLLTRHSDILDIMLVNEHCLCPTWHLVPEVTIRVDRVYAAIRTVATGENGRAFMRGDGGQPRIL